MDKAVAGTLSLSFPFLVEQKSKATQPVEEDVHPVTGSKFCLYLFDRFHKKYKSQQTAVKPKPNLNRKKIKRFDSLIEIFSIASLWFLPV